MSKRIGVLTGGGDCPGLNAVIRAVAKTSANRGWECIGVLGGYEGLLEPRRTIPVDYHRLSGLNHAYAFSGSFSAAGRRPHLIARLVQSSAQQRWN